MSIASSMGMVKQVQRAAGPQILLNTNITKRPKASSTASVQQVRGWRAVYVWGV